MANNQNTIKVPKWLAILFVAAAIGGYGDIRLRVRACELSLVRVETELKHINQSFAKRPVLPVFTAENDNHANHTNQNECNIAGSYRN